MGLDYLVVWRGRGWQECPMSSGHLHYYDHHVLLMIPRDAEMLMLAAAVVVVD